LIVEDTAELSSQVERNHLLDIARRVVQIGGWVDSIEVVRVGVLNAIVLLEFAGCGEHGRTSR
jgi:hypothetical protein